MKSVIVFLILTVVALGFWGVGFSLLNHKEAQVHAVARDLYSRQESQLNLSQLRSSVNNTSDLRSKLDSYFVREENTVGFIEKIEELGRASGLSVQISSPSISDSTLELEIKAQGAFSGVYKFITLLENLPYKIATTRADFKQNGTNWDATISLQLISFLPTS